MAKRRRKPDPMRQMDQRVRDNIARTGRHIMGVFPDVDSEDPLNESFTYSIGNSLRNLPELLLVGLCGESFAINALSELMLKRGRKFDDGEIVSLGGPFAVCVVDASEDVKREFTIQVGRQLGIADQDYDVMQVVLPDKDGRFPWQPDCAEPYRRVRTWRRDKPN